MPLFGEVVIPSSRILWDDEDDVELEDSSETLEWHGDSSIPNEIYTLLIVETTKLTEVAETCLLENSTTLCTVPEAKLSVHKLTGKNYLILCKDVQGVPTGEITELLVPWLERSKKIITIRSLATAMFYSDTQEEKPSCFIRGLLTGDVGALHAPRLEAPNLATGISAGVLSYCQHTGISACLYVCYLDSRPLDSTTAAPIIQLLQNLNIPILRPFVSRATRVESNLYM